MCFTVSSNTSLKLIYNDVLETSNDVLTYLDCSGHKCLLAVVNCHRGQSGDDLGTILGQSGDDLAAPSPSPYPRALFTICTI